MSFTTLRRTVGFILLLLTLGLSNLSYGDTKVELDRSADQVLQKLFSTNPQARELNKKAIAILVFPSITKAGFMVTGQYGEGVLLKEGRPSAYFNTAGGSFGLQAGAQQYGYAMFFMKQSALEALYSTQGFEVGTGPSVVVVDQGVATSFSTMNSQKDIYAFIFNQQGLMAGIGIQGNKITQISK